MMNRPLLLLLVASVGVEAWKLPFFSRNPTRPDASRSTKTGVATSKLDIMLGSVILLLYHQRDLTPRCSTWVITTVPETGQKRARFFNFVRDKLGRRNPFGDAGVSEVNI